MGNKVMVGAPPQKHLADILKDLDSIIELLEIIAANTTQTNVLINTMNENLGAIGEALNNWSKPVQLRKVKAPKESNPEELEEVSLHGWNVIKEDEVEEAVGVVENEDKKVRVVKAKDIVIED